MAIFFNPYRNDKAHILKLQSLVWVATFVLHLHKVQAPRREIQAAVGMMGGVGEHVLEVCERYPPHPKKQQFSKNHACHMVEKPLRHDAEKHKREAKLNVKSVHRPY